MQNVIIKGLDNPAAFVFSFTGKMAALGLTAFSEITISVGTETYDLTDHVEVIDKNILSLNIGEVTALDNGNYIPEIIGISSVYPNGFLLSGEKKRILSGTILVTTQ